jgi:hypothetical protein
MTGVICGIVSPGEITRVWAVCCWRCGTIGLLPESAGHGRPRNVGSQAVAGRWARYAGWATQYTGAGERLWACGPCLRDATPLQEFDQRTADAGAPSVELLWEETEPEPLPRDWSEEIAVMERVQARRRRVRQREVVRM